FQPQVAAPDSDLERSRRRRRRQVARLVSPEPGRPFHKFGHDEDRGRRAMFAQNREGDLVSVAITVVNRARRQAWRKLPLSQTSGQSRKRDECIMRRQILYLFGESPRRNPRPALMLAEAVVGDNQRLMAMRPSEWGECAGYSQQIEYGSFHHPPTMNERTGTVPRAVSAPSSCSPDE